MKQAVAVIQKNLENFESLCQDGGMHPKDRQKMCTSCDGRIPFDADVCPYCAAAQPSMASSSEERHYQSLQDSLASPYAPSYVAKPAAPLGSKKETQSEPWKETMAEKRFTNPSSSLGIPQIPTEAVAQEEQADEGKSVFWPLLLLSIGANLLMLGLLQLFFSDQGFLRLEWNSSYWFVYCLGALPLFFLGFKKASTLK